MQTTELRPLRAGEMLDRAITLFVRRFGPIVAVLAIVTVPVTVIEAIVDPRSAFVFMDFAKLFSSMGDPVASKHAAETIARDDRTGAAAYVFLVVAAAVRLLMWSALVRLVASAYGGGAESIADAYRVASRRWLSQLVVGLAFLVLGTICAIPVLIVYVMVVIAVVGLIALHQMIGAAVAGIIGGLIVLAGVVVIESLVFMTYELASVAVMTETASPIEAITTALRRALAPGMKRRSLTGGIVVFLVSQAGLIPVLALAVLLTATTHVGALYYAVFGAGTVLLDGIVATFVVVFAVDARVRREGYDLFASGPVTAA